MLEMIKYRFLCFLREKTTMFWGFLFPLILCTLFYVTFGDIDNSLECIPTAVVMQSHSEQADNFCDFLEQLQKTDSKLLSVKRMSKKQAEKKLKAGKITGIFLADDKPELKVSANGIEQSVLESLLQAYIDKSDMIQTLAKEKPEKLQEMISQINQTAGEGNYVAETSLGGKKTDGMIQYFFSLIAMTCMFGCFLGFDSVTKLQANLNPVAARRCIGATSKITQLLVDFVLVCVINFAEVLVLIAYMTGVLKIDLGGQWNKILLVSFLGCLIGITMGILVGSIGKWSEGTKIGVMLAISLGSSFLSGLMLSGIKGLIEEHCPIINRINPASLLSDAFYSMTIYQDNGRYTRDVVTMAAVSLAFLIVSYFAVRRVRYDSI